MIVVEPNELSDYVLEFDFETITDVLNPFCESDGWISIESVFNTKVTTTTCHMCLCLVLQGQIGILCDGPCYSWYHKACVKADKRKTKWFCIKCE